MPTNSDAELIIERGFRNAILQAWPTFKFAWPNETFEEPAANVPYAVVGYVYSSEGSIKADQDFEQFVGFVQLLLKYPKGDGSGDLLAFAAEVRNLFGAPYSFEDQSVLAVVHRTPSLGPQLDDPVRFVRAVRIPFFANNC